MNSPQKPVARVASSELLFLRVHIIRMFQSLHLQICTPPQCMHHIPALDFFQIDPQIKDCSVPQQRPSRMANHLDFVHRNHKRHPRALQRAHLYP